MASFLIKLFIKDYKNYEKKVVRDRYGIFAGVVGAVSNTILFVVKIVLGLITGSISIMADAINNLTDSVASLITLFGFYYGRKPADKEHPYGHARIEYISGLFVSLFILFTGFEFSRSSISRIIEPEIIELSPLLIFIFALTALVKLWQSFFNKKIGLKINSSTLVATAKDSMNDVLITLTVLIGSMVELLVDFHVDGYVGLLVSLFILYAGAKMLKEIIGELLGNSPSKEDIDLIKTELALHVDIINYHDLMIHSYGPKSTYVSVHIEVDAKHDSNTSHMIADKLESAFKEKLGINLVVHVDPVDLNDSEKAEYEKTILTILHNIDSQLTIHDFRLVHLEANKKIIFHLVIPEKFELSDKKLLEKVNHDIQLKYPNIVISINFDHNYFL